MTQEGEVTQVLDGTEANASPSITRDGTQLVYSSWPTYDTPSEANIFVLDLSDRMVRLVGERG